MTLVRVAVVLAFCSAGVAAALGVGDKAPSFTLPATTAPEKGLSLSDYMGKKNVVLVGIVAAFTPT
jgi:peroxiredoxin